VIRVSDLPPEIRECGCASTPLRHAPPPEQAISLAAAERQALLHVIEHNHWIMSRVAAQLGISRNTLYRKIKRHGIPLERHPERH